MEYEAPMCELLKFMFDHHLVQAYLTKSAHAKRINANKEPWNTHISCFSSVPPGASVWTVWWSAWWNATTTLTWRTSPRGSFLSSSLRSWKSKDTGSIWRKWPPCSNPNIRTSFWWGTPASCSDPSSNKCGVWTDVQVYAACCAIEFVMYAAATADKKNI